MKAPATALTCALLVASLAGVAAQTMSGPAADCAAIEAIFETYARAQNTDDVEMYLALWDRDAMQLRQDTATIVGIKAIEGRVRPRFGSTRFVTSIESQEIAAAGDWGFVRGVYTQEMTPKAGGGRGQGGGQVPQHHEEAARRRVEDLHRSLELQPAAQVGGRETCRAGRCRTGEDQSMLWRLRSVAALAAVLACRASCQQFEVPEWAGMGWYKGNTNTHTDASIGAADSAPAEVAAWYKAHGYAFVVITDRDLPVSGPPGPIDLGRAPSLTDASFVVVPGMTLGASHAGRRLYVGALNAPRAVFRVMGDTIVDTLHRNVSAAREAGAVPVVLHPNMGFTLNQEMLLAVGGYSLLEVFDGDARANNEGLAGSPSVEQMWDALLTAGRRVFGVAADNAHVYRGAGSSFYEPAYPGTGWVVVRARSLVAEEVVGNLERGLFYASTGVVLDDIVVESQRIEVRISAEQAATCRTEFIGAGGAVLAQTTANPAVYRLTGGETYVRARITDSSMRRAWVQPVFVRP